MKSNFSDVVRAYRGRDEVFAIYWGNKLKWRKSTPIVGINPSEMTLVLTSTLQQTINLTQSTACGVLIDWGDGTSRDIVEDFSARMTHTYATSGTYTVKLYAGEGVVWSPGASITTTSTSGTTTTSQYGILGGAIVSGMTKTTNHPELTSFTFGGGARLDHINAFYECNSLPSIILPPNTTTIPSNAFHGCTNLKTVGGWDNIVTIGSSGFYGCASLSPNALPANLQTIGTSGFYGCTSLPSYLEIKANSIGARAFQSCSQIDRVWLRNTVTTITVTSDTNRYYGPFADCPSTAIYAEYASKPSGWDTNFDIYSDKDKALVVFWNISETPTVSLKCIWNAVTREITWEATDTAEKGYVFNDLLHQLTIY